MQKQTIGSIFLIAGTCIGSGMIALPMVLAKLGLILSAALMLSVWGLMYYTSLINLELNLQAGQGLSLGSLGRYFSGKLAEIIGVVSIKLLSYSLLAVFIYGGASITQKLLDNQFNLITVSSYWAISAFLVLLLPIKLIDYINRILFISLLVIVAILIVGLVSMISWNNLQLFPQNFNDIITSLSATIPIVFTSFGFQVIFHTLTNYCNKNPKTLRIAFFWGSLIPAIIYIIWSSSILAVIYNQNPIFYNEIIAGTIDVGDLIKELSKITNLHYIHLLVWLISLLAIATSIIGVGVGLCDSLSASLRKVISNNLISKIISSSITILPAYIVAILVPNAFITVLGFAGMILVVIAILLPIYLLYKAKISKYNYSILHNRYLIILSGCCGIIIIICELKNIM